jgi:hypothetical protein
MYWYFNPTCWQKFRPGIRNNNIFVRMMYVNELYVAVILKY